MATNSLWDYTNVVMNHICGFSKEEERNLEWLELFDLVIVGAVKEPWKSQKSPRKDPRKELY